MQQIHEPEEQSQDEHAMLEEPASVHTEPSQDDRDAEDKRDQQTLGADAYRPPPPITHAGRHSAHQADEETTLE
jgi:hypothetical protein